METTKLLSPEQLPADSQLGGRWSRLQKKHAVIGPTRLRVESLRKEAARLRRFIDTATLDDATPEDFATATARAVLIERTILKLGEEVRISMADIASAEAGFLELNAYYARQVRRLAGDLSAAERRVVEREIAGLVGVGGDSL